MSKLWIFLHVSLFDRCKQNIFLLNCILDDHKSTGDDFWMRFRIRSNISLDHPAPLFKNQHSLVTLKIRTHFILISETIEKLIAKHMNDFWMLKMYKGMKGKFIEGPTE